MNPVRGRPGKVDPFKIKEMILKYKEVIKNNNNIISKTHDVWNVIAQELKNKVTTNNLYVFTMCNRYNVKNEILNKDPYSEKSVFASETVSNEGSMSTEMSVNSSLDDSCNEKRFIISLLRENFTNLLIDKVYKRQLKKKGKTYYRLRKVLQPGKWQELITDKFWEATRMKCGFQFKNHYISTDAKTGVINGSCRCGSTLRCVIEDIDLSSNCIKLNCTYTEGIGNCGKRYLRNPTRTTVGQKLQQKAVHVYRAEEAHMLMLEGEAEPPHLYSSAVLHAAKTEVTKQNFIHTDPLKAIAVLKFTSMNNVIHNIGLDPFFVHYWTNHQLNIYKRYSVENNACLLVDATGSIVKKLWKADGFLSKHIFLYQCVINCQNGQFSVCQMISESHNANSIHFWLAEWLRSGASVPKEIICDSSRALLIAIIRAFTGYLNIDDYADAFRNSNLPKCYIRIDVAHFIKLYSKTCKTLNKRVKIFYLGAIGQLILCRSITHAKDIVRSIFTIALSESDGNLQSGYPTQCDLEREKLINLMTANSIDFENHKTDDNNCAISDIEKIIDETDNFINNPFESSWNTWGKQILNEVKSSINLNIGDRVNPHYFPEIVKRLIVDIKLLPLWTNVYRDEFGYGRVPASSASVESEFNKLKSLLLKNCPLLRVDSFVKKHVDYLHGVSKIVDAQNVDNTTKQLSNATPIKENDNNFMPVVESCPACKNNEKPSGAHICKLCKKYVHALHQCSVAFEDGEDGQFRICIMCTSNVQNFKDILASREIENWRGLIKDANKNDALYLGKNPHKIIDALTCKKAPKIPILKNGNDLSLRSLHVRNDNYTITNTCAFDSICQILFAAGHDSKKVFQYMEESGSTNSLFRLIIYVVENGISSTVYKLRAQILSDIFPISDICGNKYVDCETNVGYLAGILLKETPSFKEVSQCNIGCPPRHKTLSVVQIDEIKIAGNINFDEVVKESVILKGEHPCCTKGCIGLEKTTLCETGDIILFEIFTTCTAVSEVKITDISRACINPLNKNTYNLIGIVSYKGPVTTRNIQMGHYTAVCLRAGAWIEYNDLDNKERKIKQNARIIPSLLIYAKEK